jgi:hypothetical protein
VRGGDVVGGGGKMAPDEAAATSVVPTTIIATVAATAAPNRRRLGAEVRVTFTTCDLQTLSRPPIAARVRCGNLSRRREIVRREPNP